MTIVTASQNPVTLTYCTARLVVSSHIVDTSGIGLVKRHSYEAISGSRVYPINVVFCCLIRKTKWSFHSLFFQMEPLTYSIWILGQRRFKLVSRHRQELPLHPVINTGKFQEHSYVISGLLHSLVIVKTMGFIYWTNKRLWRQLKNSFQHNPKFCSPLARVIRFSSLLVRLGSRIEMM